MKKMLFSKIQTKLSAGNFLRFDFNFCFVFLLPILNSRRRPTILITLKVPKREIFDRSDFPDFYTMKCLRVGDFGVKIKKILKNIWGSFRGAKFLMRMLSLFLRRFFF
jgi:hypothetical protein